MSNKGYKTEIHSENCDVPKKIQRKNVLNM